MHGTGHDTLHKTLTDNKVKAKSIHECLRLAETDVWAVTVATEVSTQGNFFKKFTFSGSNAAKFRVRQLDSVHAHF